MIRDIKDWVCVSRIWIYSLLEILMMFQKLQQKEHIKKIALHIKFLKAPMKFRKIRLSRLNMVCMNWQLLISKKAVMSVRKSPRARIIAAL